MIRHFELSKHAAERVKQRGFTASIVGFVARLGDVRKLARHGRQAVFLSDHHADVLASRGVDLAFLETARRCLVVIAKSGVVVTVHDGAWTARMFN